MPSQTENMADRDARLVKAEMDLEKAVELLRLWRDDAPVSHKTWSGDKCLECETSRFLEALDA